MLESFICPDNEKILVPDCLANCRMGERCLTLPTLVLVSQERKWEGKAGTTQLLNGTMLEYLKLTKPYAVDPSGRAFMLAGTKHHKALEEIAKELGLPAEIALNVDRDIFDLLEKEGDKLVMTDYKLWGSLKVAKALGITKIGNKPDPSGAVYKTNSKWGKMGQPKMVSIFAEVAANIDNWETELQLNRYRVMLKDLGVVVNKLQLQATVRDGGISIAESRGVVRNVYKIPIRLLPDDEVRAYFEFKDKNLHEALEHGWTEPCTPRECWDGIRCSRFCDVKQYCPKGNLIQELDKEITNE